MEYYIEAGTADSVACCIQIVPKTPAGASGKCGCGSAFYCFGDILVIFIFTGWSLFAGLHWLTRPCVNRFCHLKTTVTNSNLSVARQKPNSSNLNPTTMKITTVHSPWMNSLMLYPNLMIQLLARMMSTTKCLDTSLMMLCSLCSTLLITSGLRENSLQAGVLLQLYQFLNLVKIHLTLLTIAQLLSQVAFARLWSAWSIAV